MYSSLAILLCFLPVLIWADNTIPQITWATNLTAGDDLKSPWLSPSGDFAFGFQQAPGPSGGFLAAIWYDKIPEKTVTWSANRDELAPDGSTVQLATDGLVLSYPNGTVIWRTPSDAGVSYANMLNTGNFVIYNPSGGKIWESFDWPTDTILPTQIMKNESQLIARYSDTNYSSGRFKLMMEDDGTLVCYSINWPQTKINYFPYFKTDDTFEIGYQLVFNQSGPIYITDSKGIQVLDFVLANVVSPTQYRYQRAILESDGVFRRYVYPISSSKNQSMNWIMQDFQPDNICVNMQANAGGGVCGFNSYCEIRDDNKTKCSCPPGYSFIDEFDKMRGCKMDFIPQSCSSEPAGLEDQFELQEMDLTNFWGNDFDTFQDITESYCRNSCLSDCFCAAAVFCGTHCWKKRFPLSNGRVGKGVKEKTFLKVRMGNYTTMLARENKHQGRFLTRFLGSSVFLNILLLSLAVLATKFYRRKEKETAKVQQDIPGTSMINFSYKELQEATNGFDEEIGQGAFAVVYKGTLELELEQGKLFAVKKLHDSIKESQTEFEREVKAIARTGHRNLVQLVGFCNEELHRLLVYEYMPNGSLADILFQVQRPNWSRRVKFALETARGLNYLHEECNIQIIHCDIKPQNILLDDSFTTRISDFGLAKLMMKDQTHTLTGLRGTKGYVAPEWFRSMPITTKVDVYSYGILLLEIICCRRCYVADMEDESQIVLADWAFECCKEGRVDKLVEGDDEALADIDKVKKYVMVALCCIQEDPFHRPSMNEVVHMIKGEIEEALLRDLSSYFASLNVGYKDSLSFGIENSYYNTERPYRKYEE